jgi:tetratricopeptide (TPR) repeat protein
LASTLYDKIANKSVHIALMNPYHESRVAMIKVFHKLGYKHIMICKSVRDLNDRMRKTRVDWVISTLLEEQTVKMPLYLHGLYDDHLHDKLRVSYLLTEKQQPQLPAAFADGLLSWFELEHMEDARQIQADLEEFFRVLKDTHDRNQHEAFVAAEYFRRYLKKHMIWGDLIAMEKALCNNFPLKPENLLALAEAHFLAGEYNRGRLLVQQAQQLSAESLDKAIEELLRKFPKALLEKQGSVAERFDVRSAVIIERDEREVQILRQALKRIGVPTVKEYPSFQEAWDAMKDQTEPSLMITEWSSRKGDLSTAQFLQRVRGHGFLKLPVIVMINKLRPQEAQLLNDVHAILLMQKPLREEHAVMSVAFAIQQAKLPTERKPIEQQIVNCLQTGDRADAYYLRKMYHADTNIPPSRKYYIEAVFNYHHHNYTKARNYLIKGIKLSATEKDKDEVKPNLDKTVLLAKCLFRLGDKSIAIQMLEKARERSPYNLAILMALMEMNYDVGNVTQANAAIEEAEKIDAGNAQVIQAGAKLSLLTGRTDQAAQFLAHMDNLTEIITRMNNQAVSFIQSGDFQKGIELYLSAIKSLPPKQRDFLGVVYYNLALAFLRNEEIDPGLEHLQKSATFTESRVHRRAVNLSKRIEESKVAGKKLKFSKMVSGSDEDRESYKLLGLMDELVAQRHLSVALRGLYRVDGAGATAALDAESTEKEAS